MEHGRMTSNTAPNEAPDAIEHRIPRAVTRHGKQNDTVPAALATPFYVNLPKYWRPSHKWAVTDILR